MTTEEHVPAYIREHGSMQAPLRVAQFAGEIASLKQEPAWQRGERVARTLVKEGPLRVVLTLMPAGTHLQEHQTTGPLTLQCIEGRMLLRTQIGDPIALEPGQLIALDSAVAHAVEATTECAFLVTLAQ